jgi:hypothetical protein
MRKDKRLLSSTAILGMAATPPGYVRIQMVHRKTAARQLCVHSQPIAMPQQAPDLTSR